MIIRASTSIFLVLFAFCVSSCVNTELIELRDEREEHAELDLQFLTPEFLNDDLCFTLADIVEIALARNLDVLVKRQEYAIQREKDTGEALKMLPSLTANGLSSWRNESTASTQVQNGVLSSPIVGSPQRVEQADLTATWNLLDFGITYYRARQEHYKSINLGFQYIRQAQNLILEVYKSYWKAMAARNAVVDSQALIALSRKQQGVLQNQINERNLSEIQGLKSENQMIDIEVQLEKFRLDYETAKAELAGHMGISPFICFDLCPVEITDRIKELECLSDYENLALVNRAELFMSDLDRKIAIDDVRISILQLCPSPAMFAGRNYDQNPFLLHHYWTITGIKAAWDLLSIPAGVFELRAAKGTSYLTRLNRLTLSVGILTQVHIAYIKVGDAFKNYNLMQRQAIVMDRLVQAARKAQFYGEFSIADIISIEMDALIAKINAGKAYGDLRVSLEFLNNSIGLPLYNNPDADKFEANCLKDGEGEYAEND